MISWWKSQAFCLRKIFLTDLKNVSHGSKNTCEITVKPLSMKKKLKGINQSRRHKGCGWDLWGTVQSLKKKEVNEDKMIECGSAASQCISHSRSGLSAGGCALGEITGLLLHQSLHRHRAKDKKLLATGQLTDSFQHCQHDHIHRFTFWYEPEADAQRGSL